MVAIKNLGIVLILIVALVSVVLIVLKIIEKRLEKKLKKARYIRDNYYIGEIEKLKQYPTNQLLNKIDKIARNFFEEAFNIKSSIEYSELEKTFQKRKNEAALEFCKGMTHTLYSGEESSKQNIPVLITLLKTLIQNTHILSKEEKIEIKEQSEKARKNKK